MKQQILWNNADIFRAHVYDGGRRLVPLSATLTVYRPRTWEKIINSLPMAIGEGGLLTYQLAASDNSFADVNYRAEVSYVHGGASGLATFFYDVVRTRLAGVITDEDVVNELPQLKEIGWKVRGRAMSGSVVTIVDDELKRYGDNYFAGALACSVSKSETREVVSFDKATGTITTKPFSSAIAALEGYVITRSYSKEIERAFEKIEDRIIKLGKRPDLIADPYDLRDVHIYYSVAEVCKGFVTDPAGLWWRLWKEYESKAEAAFNGLNLKYDVAGGGRISRAEEGFRLCAAKAGRG